MVAGHVLRRRQGGYLTEGLQPAAPVAGYRCGMPSLLPQHGPDLRAGTTGPASLIPWLHNEGLGRTLRAAATLVERRVDLQEAYDHLRLGVCDG